MLFRVNFQYTFPAIGGVMAQKWFVIADVEREELPSGRVVEEVQLVRISEQTLGDMGRVNVEEIPDEHINTIRGYALQHGRRKFREYMAANSGVAMAEAHERASDAQTRFDRAQY